MEADDYGVYFNSSYNRITEEVTVKKKKSEEKKVTKKKDILGCEKVKQILNPICDTVEWRSDDAIVGKKKYSNEGITLYFYYYENKKDYDKQDKSKVIEEGDCVTAYLSGPGLENAALMKSIEFVHVFHPTEEVFEKLEDIANTAIILLTT